MLPTPASRRTKVIFLEESSVFMGSVDTQNRPLMDTSKTGHFELSALITAALARGRNAIASWQDLVDRHGFPARYAR